MKIRGKKLKRSTLIPIGLILLDVLLISTQFMSLLAVALTIGLVLYGGVRLGKIIVNRTRVIWRLRNRLFVTYVFIAMVPIALILALAGVGTYIVTGQVAAYLVTSELDRRAAALVNPARFLAQANPRDRDVIMQQMAPLLRERLPGIEVLVTSNPPYRYPEKSRIESPPAEWSDYNGSVIQDGDYYCMALVRNGDVTSIIRAPITTEVLENLVPGIGALKLFGGIDRGTHLAGRVPPGVNPFDLEIAWPSPLSVKSWSHPDRQIGGFLLISTRPSAVLGTIFGSIDWAQNWVLGFLVLGSLLAIVELAAALIGISMTRAITGAVHNLYEGTLRIGHGDFGYRIPVRGHDQLADLGKSFNKMTAQLENLVVVAKEKERLQSELTIASEVQQQLFPRCPPPTRTIRLTGECQPARSASGDYYDYLCLPNGTVALALGDVAGKGISAALLMASIQSIMRTQLAAGAPMAASVGSGRGSTHCSTAGMVAQLNRQLYANTSPEKYATFFFGLYDENSRILTYTNAGHLPPLLVCGNEIQKLEVTGTVVGLFPSVQYEEQTVSLTPGDLLVAYTDGITEPENAYGEEFGEQRLSDTILLHRDRHPAEIVTKIMDAVKLWSTAPELPDDMTVVIARGIA